MFKKEEFTQIGDIFEEGTLGKYSAKMSQAEFEGKVAGLIDKVSISIGSQVVTSVYVYADGDAVLRSVTINIRPTKKGVYVPSMSVKRSFIVSESVFEDIADFLQNWANVYVNRLRATTNLVELSADIQAIIDEDENNLPYTVNFDLGTGILEASDVNGGEITLGIPYEIAVAIADLPLYSAEYERSIELYKEAVIATFSTLSHITDIVTHRNLFTESLDIWTRKTIKKLLRASYSTRAVSALNGVGYIEDGDVFGLVTCKVCSNKELAEFKEIYGAENVVVTPNESPKAADYVLSTKSNLAKNIATLDERGIEYKEVKAGERYRLVTGLYIAKAFSLKPFNTKTGELVDIKLA